MLVLDLTAGAPHYSRDGGTKERGRKSGAHEKDSCITVGVIKGELGVPIYLA